MNCIDMPLNFKLYILWNISLIMSILKDDLPDLMLSSAE